MVLFRKHKAASEDENATEYESIPQNESLSAPAKGPLAKNAFAMGVGSLEAALLKMFPAEDAEGWDRTGLTVGNRAATVTRVALALDPTVSAIEEAAQHGANVLITHHPAFIQPPSSFSPEPSVALSAGAGVWAAIANDVALMDFHTALDVSPQAAVVLPGMLNLTFKGAVLDPIPSSKRKGYGQICELSDKDDVDSLGRLAARCTSVFGRAPRMWGSPDMKISRVVTATGSASSLVKACVEAHIDCLVCGEIKYHDALELSQAGIAVIDLGHDVSELPLVAVLLDAVIKAGVPDDRVIIVDQTSNWSYPETVRI